jgi:hypothetical protein
MNPSTRLWCPWFDRTVSAPVTSPICSAETLRLLGDPGDRRERAAHNHRLQD